LQILRIVNQNTWKQSFVDKLLQANRPCNQMNLGVFENADIQNLYNKFMSEGVNEVEALKIGAFIEEYDIADLEN